MPIWTATPIEQTPELSLARWTIREVQPRNTRHLVGYNLTEQEGRVSSHITGYDAERHRVTTESGRVYELVGDPGYNDDAEYVWESWCRRLGTQAASWTDVTHDYVRKE